MRTTYRTQRPTRPGSALARRAQLMSRHDLLKAAPSLGGSSWVTGSSIGIR